MTLSSAKLALCLQYIMCYVYISESLLNLCFMQRGDRLNVKVILTL